MCFLEIPYFFPTTNCWHLGCICLIFLHCAFSNVFSNCLNQRMHDHTGCICLTFPHCVFLNVSSKCLDQRMHSHCGFLNVSSKRLHKKMHNHTCCICLAFLHCGFSNVSSHLFKNFKSPSAFCLKTASKTDHLLQMQIVKGFNAEYQTSFHHLQLESRPPGHSDQLPGDLLHFYFEFQSILSNWIEYNES